MIRTTRTWQIGDRILVQRRGHGADAGAVRQVYRDHLVVEYDDDPGILDVVPIGDPDISALHAAARPGQLPPAYAAAVLALSLACVGTIIVALIARLPGA